MSDCKTADRPAQHHAFNAKIENSGTLYHKKMVCGAVGDGDGASYRIGMEMRRRRLMGDRSKFL